MSPNSEVKCSESEGDGERCPEEASHDGAPCCLCGMSRSEYLKKHPVPVAPTLSPAPISEGTPAAPQPPAPESGPETVSLGETVYLEAALSNLGKG